MSYCLALHACQGPISFSLHRGNDILLEHITSQTDKNGESLPSLLKSFLTDITATLSLTCHNLDFIALSTGPGRFTSTRVALAFAHGFSLAIQKPLVGMTAFEAMAFFVQENFYPTQTFFVFFQGNGERFYIQEFNTEAVALSSIECINAETLTTRAPLFELNTVTAQHIGALGMKKFQSNVHPPLPMPLYLEKLTIKTF